MTDLYFKEGDRVRCIRDSGGDSPSAYRKGFEYEVTQVYDEGRRILTKDVKSGATNGWDVENFVLVGTSGGRPRGSDLQPQTPSAVREFGTGATRDLDANKLDFEGFLSPLVLERYAEHMHKARKMPDGSMRESDNWQLGIPMVVYIKSLWRHFFAVWKLWRGLPVTEVVKGETIVKDLETELCALLFNASGMLHEHLKDRRSASNQ
jgi:hypothetical protein